jgi:hypothetical protein
MTMPKVKPFYGCFGRFARDASKTTGIHSGEWTHVRGRKTMGMSEKEISKFLASKALNDANLVRELEVAPKKTIPYCNPCNLFGHSKNQCNQMQIRMKQSKKTEKAKKSNNVIEPTIEMIEKELQNNVSDLRASENHLCKTGKELGQHVIRSKSLIEVQRKLFDHLFELQLKRVNGLKKLTLDSQQCQKPKEGFKETSSTC